MTSSFDPLPLTGVTTHTISDRKSLVQARQAARVWQSGGTFAAFLDSLPPILAGEELITVIHALADAHRDGRMILWAMGAHVIKVGLSPVIIDLMEKGIIKAVALNGAGIVHDLELAMAGNTSEDVAAAIEDGSFGMTRETGEFLNRAISRGAADGIGIGEAVGRAMLEGGLPFGDKSILMAGARLNLPVTVHVAMGTDIIHMHPSCDAAATGLGSHIDFKIFTRQVTRLAHGVFVNAGSAVILPEVFLKALTVARNLGFKPEPLTTVNLDFLRQYRPLTNVVSRPTAKGGQGFHLTGHHEIMVPLIAAGLLEALAANA